MAKNEPAAAPATATAKEGEQAPNKPEEQAPNKEANQPEPDDKSAGEVKKGVIDERALRQGNRLFKVQIKKIRGDVAGVRFNDECIAEGVTADQLEDLEDEFGEDEVKVLE